MLFRQSFMSFIVLSLSATAVLTSPLPKHNARNDVTVDGVTSNQASRSTGDSSSPSAGPAAPANPTEPPVAAPHYINQQLSLPTEGGIVTTTYGATPGHIMQSRVYALQQSPQQNHLTPQQGGPPTQPPVGAPHFNQRPLLPTEGGIVTWTGGASPGRIMRSKIYALPPSQRQQQPGMQQNHLTPQQGGQYTPFQPYPGQGGQSRGQGGQ